MFKIESLKVCCPFIHSHDNKNNGNSDKYLKYNTLHNNNNNKVDKNVIKVDK